MFLGVFGKFHSRLACNLSVNLVREFISRAGPHPLDINTNIRSEYASKSKMASFLNLVIPLSNQWSRLTISDKQVEVEIQNLGLVHFPRLRYICHCYEIDLSSWTMPMLCGVTGYRSTFAPGVPYRSQLTAVDLVFDKWGKLDVPSLARALHAMPNLQHLSSELWHCQRARDVTPLEPGDIPKRHSVNIQTLEITVKGLTSRDLIQDLYDAFSYFAPSTVNISLTLDFISEDPEESRILHTSNGGFFPYGSTVRLAIIRHPIGIFRTLGQLVDNCDILSTVQIEVPNAYAHSNPLAFFDWPKLISLRHLRFRNCDTLTEEAIEMLTRTLICPEDDGGSSCDFILRLRLLESLEFISCKKLSGIFLRS